MWRKDWGKHTTVAANSAGVQTATFQENQFNTTTQVAPFINMV